MNGNNCSTYEVFDVPVALIIFRRQNTLERIISRIAQVKPRKFYLLSDGGRTPKEQLEVEACRKKAKELITWDCEVVEHFAEHNIGVYENIAGGAKWVLEREKYAIFLEDDNLPEITFFQFCKQMLVKYENNDRILWICGTNYLNQYDSPRGHSYVFSQHLMPCGWASWSHKFAKYYNGELTLLEDKALVKEMRHRYTCKALYRQQIDAAQMEAYNMANKGKYASWDFQMAFSIRAHDLLGIVPCHNQIENIGVDVFSTHNGSSMRNPMTERFCSIKSSPIEFPLIHPEEVEPDLIYEKMVDKIILHPLKSRLRRSVARMIKRLMGRSIYEPVYKER